MENEDKSLEATPVSQDAESPVSSGPGTGTVRNWSMLCHLSALAGLVTGFGGIIGPLIVWLIKKDEIPEVNRHGKEALNFNISIAIYAIISSLLILVLIGIPLILAVIIFWLILVIKASVDASKGKEVRYPLTIRFLK